MKRIYENPKVEGTEWRSHGHEPFVYRAERPKDLLGVHAEVIADGLLPGEPLRYLLYAPIWDGRDAPFGIHAEPASHAVAVAEDRFLISRNTHTEGIEPTLRIIPFNKVLVVELGTAHLLGWFSIRFADGNSLGRHSILCRSVAIEHFASAVREYRSADARARRRELRQFPAQWKRVWQKMSVPQAREMRPLVADGERPLAVIQTRQRWAFRRGFWGNVPVCLACEGVLVATDLGLLHAGDEPAPGPGHRTYGVDVASVPWQALMGARIRREVRHGQLLPHLRLELRRGDVTTVLDMPFDEALTKRIARLARRFGLDPIHDK